MVEQRLKFIVSKNYGRQSTTIRNNDQWHVPQSYLNTMVIVGGTLTYCHHRKCRYL